MKRLARVLQVLFGANSFVSIRQLYEAASSDELSVVPAPKNSWPEREGAIRVCSQFISIFYLRTDRSDGKLIETIDVHALKYRGGAYITYVDGEIISLTHNAVVKNIAKIDMFDARDLNQILFRVRQTAM